MSKTFLSIASGPGIGLATARRFGREGYRVVLAARGQHDNGHDCPHCCHHGDMFAHDSTLIDARVIAESAQASARPLHACQSCPAPVTDFAVLARKEFRHERNDN
jgi:NAD(P)-dependent dehydrogenase (short-subunit alcohol dehydrogenase family)